MFDFVSVLHSSILAIKQKFLNQKALMNGKECKYSGLKYNKFQQVKEYICFHLKTVTLMNNNQINVGLYNRLHWNHMQSQSTSCYL